MEDRSDPPLQFLQGARAWLANVLASTVGFALHGLVSSN
jgi:hypothetical protein